MSPIRTSDCNFTFLAPPNMPNCGDLPCLRQPGLVTSFWRPEQDEIAHLAAGGTVAFTHHGDHHPVVSLGVMPAEKSAPGFDEAKGIEFATAIAKAMRLAGYKEVSVLLTDEENARVQVIPMSASLSHGDESEH